MAFDALLKTFIYIVSASLFYPVLFLLVVAFLWIIVLSGGFIGQWARPGTVDGSIGRFLLPPGGALLRFPGRFIF